jgi:hypothetical protein
LNVIRSNQDPHTANADENTNYLADVIPNAEEKEGYHDHNRNGPEVNQLRTENGGVFVRQYHKVVAFDVAKGQDDVCDRVSQ